MASLLTVALLLSAASCGTQPTPPAASPSPAVAYPVSPKAHISYTLKTPPSRWEITYQNGRVHLREQATFQIGYRFDASQKNGESQLVTNNRATGEKNGWSMEPVTVDGASGYRATYTESGKQKLFYFFAKDSVTGTLTVDLGPDGDPAMMAAADGLIKTWRWKPVEWAGTAWPMPEPVLPFTYEMPTPLAGQKQAAFLRDHIYTLRWGNQQVQVVTSQGEDPAAVKKFYEEKKASFAKSGATIRKLDDLASHQDDGLLALSKRVDEGFALKISTQGEMPSIGAIVFHRKLFYCLVSYSRGGTTPDPEGLPAMTAPFEIGRTLVLRDDLA